MRDGFDLCFDPSRRRLLEGALALTAAGLVAPGCAYFPPEPGPAFEPWNFPDPGLEPRLSLVHAALLAASPHNTQPWWFSVSEERIDLSIVPERSLGSMDPLGREQLIGIGCALENLVLAAPTFGFGASVTYLPDAGEATLLARIELTEADVDESPLFDQISRRHTNRGHYADLPLPSDAAAEMVEIVHGRPPVRLHLLQSKSDKRAFHEATVAATEAIVDDHEMWNASESWWRQTEEDITEHRDGLTMDATGMGAGTRFAGKAGRRPTPERAGRYWVRQTQNIHGTASAFGILATPELQDVQGLLEVGRAWQHLHLWLAGQGAGAQPINQLAERRDRERQRGLEPDFELRLASLLGEGEAQMLFRVGYAWDDPFKSPRRPVDWVSEEA